jgi:hypothetical protein
MLISYLGIAFNLIKPEAYEERKNICEMRKIAQYIDSKGLYFLQFI